MKCLSLLLLTLFLVHPVLAVDSAQKKTITQKAKKFVQDYGWQVGYGLSWIGIGAAAYINSRRPNVLQVNNKIMMQSIHNDTFALFMTSALANVVCFCGYIYSNKNNDISASIK